MIAINIEQIGVFVFGWFAVGFLVAFVLGKIFWKVNRVDHSRGVGDSVSER